eukprot:TRINITY_DN928_c0_g1_i14.p1 TRINITY_DN928_c0_g1~~TRINITY_DN928_c0_g1_i14.p1  ORF type:complete len:130 (+),score=2.44 TRINITY_DN928_c0_g1_i14:550-939(+)
MLPTLPTLSADTEGALLDLGGMGLPALPAMPPTGGATGGDKSMSLPALPSLPPDGNTRQIFQPRYRHCRVWMALRWMCRHCRRFLLYPMVIKHHADLLAQDFRAITFTSSVKQRAIGCVQAIMASPYVS